MSAIEPRQPAVVEGELVPLADAMPRPLQSPPAVRGCVCGNVTIRGHAGRSCAEILAIRAQVEADSQVPAWRSYVLPVLGRTAGLAAVAAVVVVAVLAVAAIVAAIVGVLAEVVAWLSATWPALAAVAVGLFLLTLGGAKCAGLHCGGCRG